MSILTIILAVLLVLIVALQILKVGISQNVINILYGVILLLIVVGNSGWIH